jgi:maltooligosyltrehalose trehalohydrolase
MAAPGRWSRKEGAGSRGCSPAPGQEFAASAPFLYFADHNPELAPKVRKGRTEFLRQFPSLDAIEDHLADPGDETSFRRCKLDHGERARHAPVWALHRDLIRLRATMPRRLDGAVLGAEAFLLRFFAEGGGRDRVLLVNLGRQLDLVPAPEPLLAPPADGRWRVLWSSENPAYGGAGSAGPESADGAWQLPAHAAVLMEADD